LTWVQELHGGREIAFLGSLFGNQSPCRPQLKSKCWPLFSTTLVEVLVEVCDDGLDVGVLLVRGSFVILKVAVVVVDSIM
jgi:hypothetical protein